MIFLLALLYTIFFLQWIKHSSFFKTSGLSISWLYFIFASKIGFGLLYAFIHHTYFDGKDTFIYLEGAKQISNTLWSHPGYYLKSLLGYSPGIPLDADVFTYPDRYLFWKDLGTYSVVHIHGLLNFFAFGYYEIHILFIAMIGMYASVNFYKVFKKCLNLPPFILLIACFFLPSLAFWTSGLHKEAYIYLGLSFIISGLHTVQTDGWSSRNVLKIIGGVFLIGIIRHYLIVLLFPAMVSYGISLYSTRRTWLIYILTYTTLGIISFGLLHTLGINPLKILSDQQALFFQEKGGSTIMGIEPITSSIWSLISMIPTAIINVLGRPFLWECKDFLQVFAAIEILFFSGLVILVPLFRKAAPYRPDPLINFIIVYVISNLLLIGILVINVGTIARYRSIGLGLLSIILFQLFDFYKSNQKKKNSVNNSKTMDVHKASKYSEYV